MKSSPVIITAHDLNTYEYTVGNANILFNKVSTLKKRGYTRSRQSSITPEYLADLDKFYNNLMEFLSLQEISLKYVKHLSKKDFIDNITDSTYIELNNNKLNENVEKYTELVKKYLSDKREKYYKVTKEPYINEQLDYLENNLNINLLNDVKSVDNVNSSLNYEEAVNYNKTLFEELRMKNGKEGRSHLGRVGKNKLNLSFGLFRNYPRYLKNKMDLLGILYILYL